MALSVALRPKGFNLDDHGAIRAPFSISSMVDITAWHLILDISFMLR
jgi:hypothetical protein